MNLSQITFQESDIFKIITIKKSDNEVISLSDEVN
jgi:hypothetical protein